ncbi:MAG TPA: glycoside hydrolase family 172 protein [Woeseiaceae bacterium]|nr:glycoside hydrolase family 172 protein [Woeseiaceae bacterium]
MTRSFRFLPLLLACGSLVASTAGAQALYHLPEGVRSRMASPENPNGAKGQGARANQGAKGHAFESIEAHGLLELLDLDGTGVIRRIKLTVDDRSPGMLRSLRIAMYWDGAEEPAVSAPLGDFFGLAFGATAVYDTALFTNAEGRSFISIVPMPYRTGARIVIYNDSDTPLEHIYYNVSFEEWDHAPEDIGYLHVYWHRATPPLGSDFVILPRVHGRGMYLGTNIGVNANPAYGDLWWGEGEVKMYLDGDRRYPSIAGTGVEDYFGTAWGAGRFIDRYSGCLIADKQRRRWACYRYHVPDPVYFHKDIEVTVQQIGGGPLAEVRKLAAAGAPLDPISVDMSGRMVNLKDMRHPPRLTDKDFPHGWTNFFRRDDWCATAWFYLDRPTDALPRPAALAERIREL